MQQLDNALAAMVTANFPVASPAAALALYEVEEYSVSWRYCEWKTGKYHWSFTWW